MVSETETIVRFILYVDVAIYLQVFVRFETFLSLYKKRSPWIFIL
jgi:hypothetical protein